VVLVVASALSMGLAVRSVAAQSTEAPIQLIVEKCRPIQVALDRRTTIRSGGQSVAATLIEPVYVYDRVVLAAGTKVVGRIERLDSPSKRSRVRAMVGGDFSAHRRISVVFEKIVLAGGEEMLIQTAPTEGLEHVVLRAAGESHRKGVVSRAREEITRQAEQVRAAAASGKAERFKEMVVRALPYHRQFVSKGTVYRAELVSPLDFGSVTPTPRAPAGAIPSSESIIDVRLVTPLRSGASPVGSRVEAVLTAPVLSADHLLILPEGSKVIGEVTLSKRAAHFHRHGKLRFVVNTFQAPDRAAQDLSASMFAVQSTEANRLTVDDEGGASSTSPKARVAAPALAALALAGSLHGRLDYDTDGAGPETEYGGAGSSAVGGLLGFGAVGIGINQLGRPFTVVTASVGLARTVYSAVVAKGREITFPEDTPLQLQLAPTAGAGKR
jgi:hypothetical protein